MPALLPLVLTALEVRRTLLECGVTVGDGPSTPCPDCGEPLLLHPDELVCTNAACSFAAGNIIDFFARTEEGSVAAALERLHHQQAALLDRVSEFPWSVTVETLEAEVTHRRALLDFFVQHQRSSTTSAVAQTIAWLRSAGIDPDTCPRTIFVLTAGELGELFARIGRVMDQPAMAVPRGDVFAVTPLWRSFSRLAGLNLQQRQRRNASLFSIDPSRIALSGVWEMGGRLERVRLCDGTATAAAYTTYSRQYGLGRPCLGLHYTASAEESWRVSRMTYLLQDGEPLAAASRLYGMVDELDLSSAVRQPLPDRLETFDEVYQAEAIELARAGMDHVDLGRFLHATAMPPRIRNRIADALQATQPALADRVRVAGASGGVYQIRNVVITETTDGYLIRRKRDPQPVRLTNFTLYFENHVRFEDASEIYHHAALLFRGGRYPLLLSRATLHSPRELESAVHAAFLRLTKSTTHLPAIFDKQLAAPLPVLFNLLLEPLHTVEGVSELGWSGTRDRFQAPGALFTPGHCAFSDYIPHPDKPLLKLFAPVSSHTVELPPPSEDTTRLCALIARFIIRSFLGRPVMPVSFRDTPAARLFLSAAFRTIGQTQPLVLHGNDRGASALQGLASWPTLASGLPAGAENRFFAPLVLLQDRGYAWNEADLAQTPWLHQALAGTVSWVMTLAPAALPELYSDQDDAVEEGFRLLRLALPGVAWARPAVRFPRLWEALRQTPISNLGTWLALDFEHQEVVCTLKAAPGDDLEAELIALDATIDGKIARVPSVPLLAALGDFYGTAPILPPVAPEGITPVTTPVSDERTGITSK